MRTDAEKIADIKKAPTLQAQLAIAIEGWNERDIPPVVAHAVTLGQPLMFKDFKRVLNAAFCSTNYLKEGK